MFGSCLRMGCCKKSPQIEKINDNCNSESDTDFTIDNFDEVWSSCILTKGLVLIWLWSASLWQIYLALRQHNILNCNVEKPDELAFIDDEKFKTSRSYALDKINHSIFTCAYTLAMNSLEIYFGLYYTLWTTFENPQDSEFVKDYIWLTTLMTAYLISDIPVSYYDSCVIKNKYSILHKTLENFAFSEMRFFIIIIVFIGPLLTIGLNIIKMVPYFWFWSWALFTVILFVLAILYPGYISPFCEKYQVFPEGCLKKSIINFMETFGMNTVQVYELKSRKENEHSNILIGKRLDGYFVVVDKREFSQNEILAVLAHEIGHIYHKHHPKLVVMYSLYYFIMFVVFALTYATNCMFCIVGFPENNHPKVVNMVSIVFYVLAPLNKFVRFFINQFIREFEVEADKFVVDSGLGEELIEAVIKRSKEIDVICIFDKLYSEWTLSQPTFAERLKMLQNFIRNDDLSTCQSSEDDDDDDDDNDNDSDDSDNDSCSPTVKTDCTTNCSEECQ